jgi:hypothetical protein
MWIQVTIVAVVALVFFLRLAMKVRRQALRPRIREQDS